MQAHSVLRRLVPLAALTAALLASSCASTGGGPAESLFGKVLIRYEDYRLHGRTGQQIQQPALSLVNQAAHDRVEYYSQARGDGSVKVASNEIVNALIQGFESQGFWDHARRSAMPPQDKRLEAGEQLHGILSVETRADKGWITFRRGLSKEELSLFKACSTTFVTTYNNTAGYQLIHNSEGEGLFTQ